MTAEAEEEAEEASLSEPDCSPSAPLSPWDGRAGVRGPGGLRSGRGSAPALIGAAACERPAERQPRGGTHAPHVRPGPHRTARLGAVASGRAAPASATPAMLSAPCACACAISRSRSARRSSPAIALPRWLRPVTRGRRGLRAGHGTGHGTRHEPTHEQPTHEPKSKKRSLLTLVPDDAEDTAFQIYFAGKRAGRRRRGAGLRRGQTPRGVWARESPPPRG